MIENRFPASGLSAEYGDIIMDTVAGSVAVSVMHAGNLLLSEVYTPDTDGKIFIHELGTLAMLLKTNNDLLLTNGVESNSVVLSVSLTEGVQVITKDVTFYQSIVDFSGSLDVTTLRIIPLSRMTKKITGPGRTEFVSFYGPGTVKVYIAKKGIDQDVSVTLDLLVMDVASMYRINVSPAVIALMTGCTVADLIYYNIYTSTDCIIRFTMDQRNYPQKRTFIFRNCFGAQESFTCIGDEESSRKWERTFGVQSNKQLQISRDLVNSIAVNTGYVSAQSVEALEDLINSDQLALLDAQGFQPIVILEEDFKNGSRRDELRSFSFTYRYASNNQFRTTYAAFKKPRVFDATFDETFN